MDCLRSFNFAITYTDTVNAAAGLDAWTIGGQNFFIFQSDKCDQSCKNFIS